MKRSLAVTVAATLFLIAASAWGNAPPPWLYCEFMEPGDSCHEEPYFVNAICVEHPDEDCPGLAEMPEEERFDDDPDGRCIYCEAPEDAGSNDGDPNDDCVNCDASEISNDVDPPTTGGCTVASGASASGFAGLLILTVIGVVRRRQH